MAGIVLAGVLGSTVFGVLRPGTVLPDPPPAPEFGEMDVSALHRATRASLLCGSEFLLSQIRDFTNEWTFVIEPCEITTGHRDEKIVERRFTRKQVEVGVWHHVWEKYYTMVPVGDDSAAGRQRFRRVEGKRLVSRRRTGTRTEWHLVRDPNGEIVKKIRIPTGPIIGDLWQPGFLGQNAMVLFALLKAGVSEYDPRVEKLATSLRRAITDYGVPDVTWDVAWLAAAFSRMTDPMIEKPRREVINRLLDSQITEGRARGMWGPLCINMRLLAAFIAYEQSLERELENGELKLKARPRSRARMAHVEKVKNTIEDVLTFYTKITQQGHRFADVIKRYKLDDHIDLATDRETWTSGLPYFFFNQSLADMDSTATALFALREVAEAGCLPEETEHPKLDGKQQLLPPEKASAILARAAHAIAERQNEDGTWDSGKVHERSIAFAALQVQPWHDIGPIDMASTNNFLTTAQGFSALMDAGHAAGVEKLIQRFREPVTLGRRAQLKVTEGHLRNEEKIIMPVQGNLAPYELLFRLSRVFREPGTARDDRRDLWGRLAYRTMMRQAHEGSWGGGIVILHSSSAWEYLNRYHKFLYERRGARKGEKGRDYDAWYFWRQKGRAVWVDARLASTCFAMLFLEDGIRMPVAGYLASGTDAGPSPILKTAVDVVRRKSGIRARVAPIAKKNASMAVALPLFIVGLADLDSPAKEAVVKSVLASSGTVVVEIPPGAGYAGQAKRLLGMVAEGKAVSLPADTRFYRKYRGKKRPSVPAIVRPDGRPAALLLVLHRERSAQPGKVSYSEAVLTVAAFIEDYYAETLTNHLDYPTRLEGLKEPFAERITLLHRVNKGAFGLASDETWEPVPEVKEAPATEPASDETW